MSDVTRSMKEGIGFGLIAGVAFLLAQVIGTVIVGDPAIVVFRRFASLLLGPRALVTLPAATAIGIGLIAHLLLSAAYGLFYGVYNSALTLPTRRSLPRQAVIGPLYGVMLWLVNFRFFAPYRFPWFLELAVWPQLVAHVVFFGLPLGLLYGSAERRVAPARRRHRYRYVEHR